MASNNELPTGTWTIKNISLHTLENQPGTTDRTNLLCAKLKQLRLTSVDTLSLSKDLKNMITTLKQSDAQDVNTTPPLLRWSNNAPTMKIYLTKR
ncbi:hypothetical protein TNCV_2581341 [Trichonephila clavipes]|nr:hypothetical protein TNCV_2581341 [Trichonephila clavipes]